MATQYLLVVSKLPAGQPLYFNKTGEHRQGETVYVTKSKKKAKSFRSEEEAQEAKKEVERISTHPKNDLAIVPR